MDKIEEVAKNLIKKLEDPDSLPAPFPLQWLGKRSAIPFLHTLPLRSILTPWNITLSAQATYGGLPEPQYRGLTYFYPDNSIEIEMYARSVNTWIHELMHVAATKNGRDPGAKSIDSYGIDHLWIRDETIAEFGAAIALTCLNMEEHVDIGRCFHYVRCHLAHLPYPRTVATKCKSNLPLVCSDVETLLRTAGVETC